MNEFIVADINPDVSERPVGVEKDQIALSEIVASDADADLGLLAGAARQRNVENAVNPLNKGRTINALQGCAEPVRRSDKASSPLLP